MTISPYQTLIKAPGPNAPIVFAFHGMGGDEYQFAELTRQILPDAGVISPRGDVSEFGALRFFRRTSEGSYDMEDLILRTEKMARFIAAHKAANPGGQFTGSAIRTGQTSLRPFCSRMPAFSTELPCCIHSFHGPPRTASS